MMVAQAVLRTKGSDYREHTVTVNGCEDLRNHLLVAESFSIHRHRVFEKMLAQLSG
jgi:hypothetical protein